MAGDRKETHFCGVFRVSAWIQWNTREHESHVVHVFHVVGVFHVFHVVGVFRVPGGTQWNTAGIRVPCVPPGQRNTLGGWVMRYPAEITDG